jgi:hypothetical protein
MLYSICFYLSVWTFGIAETEIVRGSPPGTTTEVQRVGFPSAENRFVSTTPCLHLFGTALGKRAPGVIRGALPKGP